MVAIPNYESWLQVSLPTQYNQGNQDPVGALSGALARLQSSRPLRELREIAKAATKQLPEAFQVLSTGIARFFGSTSGCENIDGRHAELVVFSIKACSH